MSVWVKRSKSKEELILVTYMTYILPIQPTLFLGISDVAHIYISIRCETLFLSFDQNWDKIASATRSYIEKTT